jgi:G:T-mismatch repair DNA endonuclease (very short patch repair protein)
MVCTDWECAVKCRNRKPFKNLIEQISNWITVSEISEEVNGASSSLQD